MMQFLIKECKLLFLEIDSSSYLIYYMNNSKKEEIKQMLRNAVYFNGKEKSFLEAHNLNLKS